MEQLFNWFLSASATDKLSSTALAVSAISALISISGGIIARKALKLSTTQDARMKPSLNVEYLQSICHVGTETRDYDVEVNVRNASDGPNSISGAELEILYALGESLLSMRVRAQSGGASERSLGMPTELSPRTSREGSLHFLVRNEALEGQRVRGYTLRISDTFQNMVELPIDLIKQNRIISGQHKDV